MTLANDEYGRRTLEFVAAIMKATSIDDVRRLIASELAHYGMEFVTSWSLPELAEDLSGSVDMNTRPESYVDYYMEAGLVTCDPVVTTMRATMETRSWGEVRKNRNLSKRERFIIDEAREFGATDGLTIPVVSSTGFLGAFSPCGYKPDLSPRARAALEIVGVYGHQALKRLRKKETLGAEPPPRLTPREREIMRWVALGKTNEEIGSILGIERTSVRTMLSRAQEKLNASGRTYAVVQALRRGELDLNF